MYQVIEVLASETGISTDKANQIFKVISEQLEARIPAFKQLIEDVFENVEASKLNEHINTAIIQLQKQSTDTFKTWSMPDQSHVRVNHVGKHSIF